MDKSRCVGCRDDFYNGKNPYGVKECWSFKTAMLVMKKRVHIDQCPPWNQKPEEVPSCYRASGFVFVSPECTH